MANLDKLKLWDKQIKVTPSKHTVVQMPKEGQPVSYLINDPCTLLEILYSSCASRWETYVITSHSVVAEKTSYAQ